MTNVQRMRAAAAAPKSAPTPAPKVAAPQSAQKVADPKPAPTPATVVVPKRAPTPDVVRRDNRAATRGRLPDGAKFEVVYSAATRTWSGTLTVDGAVFTADRPAVFSLLESLDIMYRAAKYGGATPTPQN